MATLRELIEQRDALSREIKDREIALVQLSVNNLRIDLTEHFDEKYSLETVAIIAARQGLALTTTKHDLKKYYVLFERGTNMVETISVEKTLEDAQGVAMKRKNFHTQWAAHDSHGRGWECGNWYIEEIESKVTS